MPKHLGKAWLRAWERAFPAPKGKRARKRLTGVPSMPPTPTECACLRGKSCDVSHDPAQCPCLLCQGFGDLCVTGNCQSCRADPASPYNTGRRLVLVPGGVFEVNIKREA